MGIAKPTITNRVNGMKMRGKQAKQCIAIGDCDIPSDANSVNVIVIGDLGPSGLDFITDSVFIGPQTARNVTTGNGNVAVGNLTLNSIVETYHNTCVGDATGRYLETGSGGNVFMGYIAGENFTSANYNVVIGSYGGAYSTTGDYNILIGGYAGAHSENVSTTIGDHNIAMGYTSQLYGEGDHNISMGRESLHSVLGSDNIAIGQKAGFTLTSAGANKNIFIGTNAGWSTGVQKSDAVNTICIGADTLSTADNQTVIGNNATTATRLRGNLTCGSLNIEADWIGTPGPTNGAVWRNSGKLYITGDTVATKFLSNNNGLFVLELYNDGRINMLPPSSSTPNDNGQVTFEFTNNTTLTIKGKGTDGTVRSVALTLA